MRRKLITAAVALSFGFSLFASQAFASAGTVKQSANFRTAPSTSSHVMGLVNSGARVEVLSTSKYWTKIMYNGKTGYVSTSRINVTGQAVPVRTNPAPGVNPSVPSLNPSAPGVKPSAPDAKASVTGQAIIATGEKYLGVKYVFGGDYDKDGSGGFDCSGFVARVFADNGIKVTRQSAKSAANDGYEVSFADAQIGDLIYFKSYGSTSSKITHIGIYAGNNKVLHTYGAGGVKYSDLTGSWKSRVVKVKRVL